MRNHRQKRRARNLHIFLVLRFIICGKNFSQLKSVILQNSCIPEASGIKILMSRGLKSEVSV